MMATTPASSQLGLQVEQRLTYVSMSCHLLLDSTVCLSGSPGFDPQPDYAGTHLSIFQMNANMSKKSGTVDLHMV
jgi:hypothetical protein